MTGPSIGPHLRQESSGRELNSLRTMNLNMDDGPSIIASDENISNIANEQHNVPELPELRRIPSFQYNSINSLRHSYSLKLIKKLVFEILTVIILTCLLVWSNELTFKLNSKQ